MKLLTPSLKAYVKLWKSDTEILKVRLARKDREYSVRTS